MPQALSGKRVLVTGATGFIGGRLIERLVQEGNVKVRALVRNFARASRIARFNIEMVPGDVLDQEATARAAQGCEVVFHFAWGDRRVNIEGTRNILNSSVSAKVDRFIYLSTISVYGATPDGDLSESAPKHHSGDEYSESKLEAEELVLRYYREGSLPMVILQPTVVYGPWAPVWTIFPLQQLKTGKVILVNGGNGFSNAVYVDDLISAILLATKEPAAVGHTFIISGGSPYPWSDFFGFYEKMLGRKATMEYSTKILLKMVKKKPKSNNTFNQIRSALKRHPGVINGIVNLPVMAVPSKLACKIFSPSFLTSVRDRLTGTYNLPFNCNNGSIHSLSMEQAHFFAKKTLFRNDKAKSILGYAPKFSMEQGMKLTEQWARWAGLLESSDN